MRGPIGTQVPGPTGGAHELERLGPDGELAHQMGSGQVRPPETPGGAAPPGSGKGPTPSLVPSRQALDKAFGVGSGSPDFLEEMEEADTTSLNSKKWKFADFFNRVKRSVSETWYPDQLLERHDPNGSIYGATDRTTVLKVKLRRDGRIEDIQVARSSNVDFLDDGAVSAFKQAQPFENPPAGLVGSDGFIRFNFGFIVHLSGHTSFKFYKYRD